MPFSKKIETPEGVIGIWELTESSSNLEADFQFSDAEKATFENFKIEKRKKEFLAVRLLLKKILGQKAEIIYDESGKPKIQNSNYNLSISHSTQLAVVFLSKKNIGIDAENITRNIKTVVDRFLSEKEKEQTSNTSDTQTAQIIYWSAKEAIFKCTREKNIQFNTGILIQPETKPGQLHGQQLKNNCTAHFELRYFFHQNNVVVYCVEQAEKKSAE
ncbi:MAG: 4'-phosphopantetheinyl transferase family protein [Bacteroidota bacterium]